MLTPVNIVLAKEPQRAPDSPVETHFFHGEAALRKQARPGNRGSSNIVKDVQFRAEVIVVFSSDLIAPICNTPQFPSAVHTLHFFGGLQFGQFLQKLEQGFIIFEAEIFGNLVVDFRRLFDQGNHKGVTLIRQGHMTCTGIDGACAPFRQAAVFERFQDPGNADFVNARAL